jgi:hypothetical protein
LHFNPNLDYNFDEIAFAGIGHQIGRFVSGQEFKKLQTCAKRHVARIGWLGTRQIIQGKYYRT